MEYKETIFDELPNSAFDKIQEDAQAGYVNFGPAETSPDEIRELAIAN